jgi:hypothetical protein
MPYCSRCKSAVDDVRSHRCATNAATNTKSNERLTGATNRKVGVRPTPVASPKVVEAGGVLHAVPAVLGPVASDVNKTANRRSRESYNAYQREYMRKRRASN